MSEWVLHVKALVDSLLGCETITEQDQVEMIFEGIPEEYSPPVMQMYGQIDPLPFMMLKLFICPRSVIGIFLSRTLAIIVTHQPIGNTHEYSLPNELDSQAWFIDSSVSHHLTTYDSCLKNKPILSRL